MPTMRLSREIEVNDTYDVIVAGGGPAGCAAAIASARDGAKTLLLEGSGALGGMGTSGLVPAWCPFNDKEKIIYRGIAETVFFKSRVGVSHIGKDDTTWVPIDAEVLKRVYDELVTSAGADILFHSSVCGVEMKSPGTVDAVLVSNKDGLTAYRARVFIDCTGDADIAAWAGADYEKGDGTGELQPATHCFLLGNVDEYAYRFGPGLHPSNPNSPAHKILASGKYPLIPDVHMCNNLSGPRTVGFNAGHLWNVDNTNPVDVSKALITGRKMAAAIRDALAEFHPAAFASSFLAATGSYLGVRETRRILGDYVLTTEDYQARRSFPDEIGRNSYYLDVHRSVKETKEGCDLEKRTQRYGPGESHGIPYRCLTPKGLRNVLVAGRCISTDRAVQGSTRVMPVCLVMGEAVGAAAAMAKNQPQVDVHAVDVQALRTRLREAGAYLPQ